MKLIFSTILAIVIPGIVVALRPMNSYTKSFNSFKKNSGNLLSAAEKTYKYKTTFVDQRIDHFGWASDATYKQKVLHSGQHWKPNGPILFYAGNEGAIELFLENAGQLWDLAPELNGYVVFAEHRYYGASLPFGNSSFTSRENLAYFSANQALADYAVLIRTIKKDWLGDENGKTIVFGGSYGGMLAAWMRMKYPDVVDGAIASSAPIWAFHWPCDSYAKVVTADFVKYGSQNCRKNIRRSWNVINTLGKTEVGREKLGNIFKACSAVNASTGVDLLKGFVENAYSTVAMVNYPYPTDFLAHLPAWPIKVMCEPGLNKDLTKDDDELLKAISRAVDVFYNFTGTAGKCYDIENPNSGAPQLSDEGWGFQTCTEMTMPFCNTGVDDMFEPSEWSFPAFSDQCAKTWFGIRPNLNWTDVTYWGKRIKAASNIVFSNGLLDPWSAGGVLKPVSQLLPTVIIPDGAHHLELRAKNNKFDTLATKHAREIETAWIHRWLHESNILEIRPVQA